MEGRMVQHLAVLLLLVGSGMTIPEDEVKEGSGSSRQHSNGSGKQKSIIQKVENLCHGVFCSVWGIFPTWIGSLPLKLPFLKERMVKVGPAPSCLELILNAEYSLPSSTDIKKLKENKLPVFWVLGGPGSGKGTFCKMLASSEGYTHISVGDLLRAQIEKDPNSLTNRLIDVTMKEGTLVPESVALTVLARKMISELENSKGFLIDGFPRSLSQAKTFQNKIKPPNAIIYLKVSDEVMKERVLKRNDNRPDDNEETIKKRLVVFHKQQGAVISNKIFANKVKEVNAEGDLNKNFQRFSEAVHESVKTSATDSQ